MRTMDVLPYILGPRLPLVISGTAVGECAAARGHYYAQPGNAFWQLLHEAGLTRTRLGPEEDAALPQHGIGLADLVLTSARSSRGGPDRGPGFDVATFAAKMARCRPRWIAFNGKVAAEAAARAQGLRRPGLGPQRWSLGEAQVFVLPSSSGANRRREYDGRPSRLSWWAELAGLVREQPPPGR